MNINYKDWNLKNLGNLLILGLVFVLIITVMHVAVVPLLGKILPAVFATGMSLTEILLFLILIVLFIR